MATWQREGEGTLLARNSRGHRIQEGIFKINEEKQKTKVNLDCIRTCLISPPELLFWIYKKAVRLDENIHAKVWFQKKYYTDDF